MELLIKIPKEFEQHFKQDAFEDSLHRLSADAHLIAGLYEQEIAKMLRDAFKNAIPVPPHGDLIDRDELKKKELVIDGIIHYYEPISIEEAPVIIPASEEET